MSAYIVAPETIATIQSALPIDLVEQLCQQNIASIAARYPDTKGNEVKSFTGMDPAFWVARAKRRPEPKPSATMVLDAIREYDYQSCETPDYRMSSISLLLMALKPAIEAKAKEEARAADMAARIEYRAASAASAELLAHVVPDWAKSAIIAERHESDCDTQFDHWGSTTKQTLILAFSKHTRNLFPELRKAADRAPETRHLGKGKTQAQVYLAVPQDYPDSVVYINGDDCCPGMGVNHGRIDMPAPFETMAQARAYIDDSTPVVTNTDDGDLLILEYRIRETTLEHRETYSMGRGTYLATDTYQGWQVRKVSLDALRCSLVTPTDIRT